MIKSLLLIFTTVVAVAATRDSELAAFKKSFPAHTAGPVTEKSDPLVIECYKRYKDVIDRMTLDSLPSDLSGMRKRLDYEIQHYEYELDRAKESTNRDSSRQKVLTASMRHAAAEMCARLGASATLLRSCIQRLFPLGRLSGVR
jgi:hypothetical protein